MLFNTCNYRCGYCGFATSGEVQNKNDLSPFRDKAYIDKVVNFFNTNSNDGNKWILHLSGGEPLLMPNLNYFCRSIIESGHKIALNTNLSVPIDKNGWLENSPPESIDCIITSLHQQSLDNYETIYNRVRLLKEKEYPICVRMVAHPRFIDFFEKLDREFKKIDVSFSVNPFYSPNYPKAYSKNQKDHIIKYMRVNYEVLRLNGGLNMSGRKCHAGSNLICLALGQSGRGKVYPCASTSTEALCLGNIFSGVRLLNEPTTCLREDKVCSCAIHFIHGNIPTADDSEAHQKMVSGYQPSIETTWKNWFSKRNIKTKFHSSTPQGTHDGENILVLKGKSCKEKLLDEKPVKIARKSLITVPAFSDWSKSNELIDRLKLTGKSFGVQTQKLKYNIFLVSPSVRLSLGVYLFQFNLKLRSGGLTFGLLNENGTEWLKYTNYQDTLAVDFEYIVEKRHQFIKIALAACNHDKPHTVDFELTPIYIQRISGIAGVCRKRAINLKKKSIEKWQLFVKPHIYIKKIELSVKIGRFLSALCKKYSIRINSNTYVLIDSVEAGYAVRSIVSLKNLNGKKMLVTADVGDDSISVISVTEGRLRQSRKIKFTNRSAPMHLGVIKRNKADESPLICFFNFDVSGKDTESTSLALLSYIDNQSSINIIQDNSETMDIIHSRKGFWGYRGVHVLQDPDYNFRIAAIDRHQGTFLRFSGNYENNNISTKFEQIDIGSDTEPIGLNAVCQNSTKLTADYYITSRNSKEIIVVGPKDEGKIGVKQRFKIKGKSRSSVATGAFRAKNKKEIAVAIWGGDPTRLNDFGIGEFVVGDTDENGYIYNTVYQKAGMHPTDIAAGDLDGDGIDELVVLNYGVGLGPLDRKHSGSVQVFKYLKNKFQCISTVKVPNPRIALVTDIDDDGKDEAIISLFFEKKLVVLKHI